MMNMCRPIPWLILLLLRLFFVCFISSFPFSSAQSNSQNLETFYPFPIPSPTPSPTDPIYPPNSSSLLPPGTSSSASPPSLLPPAKNDSSWDTTVVKAVVATAGSTFVIATLFFLFIQRQVSRRRRRKGDTNSGGGQPGLVDDQLGGVDEKTEIVDENGLDMLYWRKLEEQNKNNSFEQVRNNGSSSENEEDCDEEPPGRSNPEPIQEIPLLRGKSSFSQNKVAPEIARPPPPPPPPPAPPPPPPAPAPPPPPPKKNPTAPPPPPKAVAKGGPSTSEDGTENKSSQVKLKPLHWDKVNKNSDQSMVWDKIGGGSFRVDDDLMEALFGYVATNRRTEKDRGPSSLKNESSSSIPIQIFILDAKKSRNTAIVLKTLGVSRAEIINTLRDGHGLDGETLEKLMRMAPSKEEESHILNYDGDPNRLADAEFFIYHVLKEIPSAFTRISAMLFRLNYDLEILQFKESLQTLELGCKELRNRGLFVKLLEAILKAGNRMNAGTSRGNAQAFDLSSLQKLSDVKSTDGKTTLLHFIVEEVVRSEGKRCVTNRNRGLNRSRSSSSSGNSRNLASPSKAEREKEYMMLGLPMVGGLSAEFTYVKKAAWIDYDSFAGTCSALSARLEEVRLIGSNCAGNGEDKFAKEMKGFVELAEIELKMMNDEQTKVMELVRTTTEYYQAGASKNKGNQPLQLFVTIKDFLNMVDQVCIEITRDTQKRKPEPPSSGLSSPPKSPALRMKARFANLPEHFLKEKSRSSSSESDSDISHKREN